MIPMHCLWDKANKRTRGQFECDVTWFCFCFDFVRSKGRCGCCFIVYLRFQVVQNKAGRLQYEKNFEQKTFLDIFGQLRTETIKPRKSRY